MDDEGKKKIEQTMAEMKSGGMSSALLRADGIIIHSTFSLEEAGANTIANALNVNDAIMKQLLDKQKEVEITIDGLYFLAVPMKSFILCSVLKDRELKQKVREYSEKIRQYL
jgi:hypothetical protein